MELPQDLKIPLWLAFVICSTFLLDSGAICFTQFMYFLHLDFMGKAYIFNCSENVDVAELKFVVSH